jgi:hypothetical protein
MRILEFTVRFSFVFFPFFSNCNIFRLQNVPTKFGDAAFNGGKDMLTMGKKCGNWNSRCVFLFIFFTFFLIPIRNAPANLVMLHSVALTKSQPIAGADGNYWSAIRRLYVTVRM